MYFSNSYSQQNAKEFSKVGYAFFPYDLPTYYLGDSLQVIVFVGAAEVLQVRAEQVPAIVSRRVRTLPVVPQAVGVRVRHDKPVVNRVDFAKIMLKAHSHEMYMLHHGAL